MSVITDMTLIVFSHEDEAVERLNAWCRDNDPGQQQFGRLDETAAGGRKAFSADIWAMSGNYFSWPDLVAALPTFGWSQPDAVILLVGHEQDDEPRAFRADGRTAAWEPADATDTRYPSDGGERPAEAAVAPLRAISSDHPECTCHRRGRHNVAWSAPSPLWNAVMRGGSIGGEDEHDGIVCPSCFALLAQERGIADLWRFAAERVHVELETTSPDGRVWDDRQWLWVEPPHPRYGTLGGPEIEDDAPEAPTAIVAGAAIALDGAPLQWADVERLAAARDSGSHLIAHIKPVVVDGLPDNLIAFVSPRTDPGCIARTCDHRHEVVTRVEAEPARQHGTVITVPLGEPSPPEGEALGVTDDQRHDVVKTMGDLRDGLRPARRWAYPEEVSFDVGIGTEAPIRRADRRPVRRPDGPGALMEDEGVDPDPIRPMDDSVAQDDVEPRGGW